MAIGRKTGGGSRKNIPNRITADLKGMILGALSDAGGRGYLAAQAEQNPSAFMALIGKVLPLQMVGEGGGAIVVRWERNADDHDPV